ncbi:unnamed protein product [Microthlaspi erraticum]|uniref:Agenet domain-containing protein n=1 Tax=Microthlaspi erraticum TaxID=1685480 RepID=A0A6D2JFG2_9BRAS|nr:unnamed protein product [Microthlaspi erraticum]
MSTIPSDKLFMMEGCEVEFCYKNNVFKNVWYKAVIEANPKPRLGERCVRLLKDDSLTLLTELTEKAWFRPVPPKYLEDLVHIKEGSVVDADLTDSWCWCTGLVVKRIESDKFLVLFDTPPDIIQFERKHLRPHLDWVDEKWFEIPRPYVQESMFSSGTPVEVSSLKNKTEIVWGPAMIIKEINESDEKKYLVKLCADNLSFKGVKGRPIITVDWSRVRPRPPPFSVEEYQSLEYIEVFHWASWRQGRMIRILPRKWGLVTIDAENKEVSCKLSDIRPSKVWEDGVWKSRESLLTQGPVNKTLPRDQNGLGNDSTRENEASEDNSRKRKRDLTSVAIVEENEAKDITTVLPFEKKLPIWKTFESMEVFKMFPQSPHFIPLLESREDSREMSAVGLMFTFSGLLEAVKDLQPEDPTRSLTSLNDSFAELEKHGFDVKMPVLRINKLLSLRDKQASKMEELKGAEKVTAEKESVKVENQRKILALQRKNEEVEKEIDQSKSCEEMIVQQLEDVKLQYQATASAPW